MTRERPSVRVLGLNAMPSWSAPVSPAYICCIGPASQPAAPARDGLHKPSHAVRRATRSHKMESEAYLRRFRVKNCPDIGPLLRIQGLLPGVQAHSSPSLLRNAAPGHPQVAQGEQSDELLTASKCAKVTRCRLSALPRFRGEGLSRWRRIRTEQGSADFPDSAARCGMGGVGHPCDCCQPWNGLHAFDVCCAVRRSTCRWSCKDSDGQLAQAKKIVVAFLASPVSSYVTGQEIGRWRSVASIDAPVIRCSRLVVI